MKSIQDRKWAETFKKEWGFYPIAGGVDKTFTQTEVDALIAEKTRDTLTQDKVDAIVQDRLAREKAKFSDYDDLRKFKTEHEKQLDAAKTKELEAQKEYEKLKEGWAKKDQEFQSIISKKDSEITDMKIGSSLMTEIVKQNAYAEESMALIKSQAVFNSQDGSIKIKSRDANGLEVLHSIEEGIKQFLAQRPHLVKAIKPGGGGTSPGGPGGGGAGASDLNTLNAELQSAMITGDRKKVDEIKLKISAIQGAKRVTL